jgi:hypothetical protein
MFSAHAGATADGAFATVQAALQSNQFARVRVLAQEFTVKHDGDPRVPTVMFWKGLAEFKEGNENAARGTWAGSWRITARATPRRWRWNNWRPVMTAKDSGRRRKIVCGGC